MSTGRYQSKLFNFASQQSLRLRDKTGQTWRQMRSWAVWGVQIMLYPVYAVFQGTRLVEKQFRQTVQQTLPRLQAAQETLQQVILYPDKPLETVTADTPIQKTLEAFQELDLALLPNGVHGGEIAKQEAVAIGRENLDQQKGSASPSIQGAIQGVATLLDTRKLVLVTVHNQILDLLTVEQQIHLQRQMVWELANYWQHQRRLQPQRRSPFVSTYLPLPKDREHTLPPVRWFRRLMGWVQTSPVAITTNLFQESKLIRGMAIVPQEAIGFTHISDHAPDHTVNQISNQAFDPVSNNQAFDPVLNPLVLRSVQPEWLGWENAMQNQMQNQMQQHSQISWIDEVKASISDLAQFTTSGLMNLLQKTGLVLYRPTAVESVSLVTKASEPRETSESPKTWLTMEALFSPPMRSAALDAIARDTAALSASSVVTPGIASDIAAWELQDTAELETLTKAKLAKTRRLQSSDVVPRKRRKIDRSPAPLHPTVTVPMKMDTQPQSEHFAIEPVSWIETEAKLVGYEKHPLEQLLEWLDRGMLWIEEKLVRIWKWLGDRFSDKRQ